MYISKIGFRLLKSRKNFNLESDFNMAQGSSCFSTDFMFCYGSLLRKREALEKFEDKLRETKIFRPLRNRPIEQTCSFKTFRSSFRISNTT